MKELQAFAGLAQTGELDGATLELMMTPRCGVRDFIGPGATARRRRRRRYVLQVRYPGSALLGQIMMLP